MKTEWKEKFAERKVNGKRKDGEEQPRTNGNRGKASAVLGESTVVVLADGDLAGENKAISLSLQS